MAAKNPKRLHEFDGKGLYEVAVFHGHLRPKLTRNPVAGTLIAECDCGAVFRQNVDGEITLENGGQFCKDFFISDYYKSAALFVAITAFAEKIVGESIVRIMPVIDRPFLLAVRGGFAPSDVEKSLRTLVALAECAEEIGLLPAKPVSDVLFWARVGAQVLE